MARYLLGPYNQTGVGRHTVLERAVVMDPKPRPNHRAYLEILRSMTPDQKLQTVFELSELGKSLFLDGLRVRFPDASREELHQIYLDRLEKCHNRNY